MSPPVPSARRSVHRRRNTLNARRRSRRQRFVTESLEPRQLLAGDLQLDFSALDGGSQTDAFMAVEIDTAGNSYAVGYTDSTWGGPALGGRDSIVRKFDPDGQVLWTRRFGGSAVDLASSIAIDSHGDLIIGGYTESTSWISGGHNTSYNGNGDMFIIKMDSAGNPLWSTYLGGSSADSPGDVAVDAADNILISGRTSSAGWAGGTYAGATDVYVGKLTPTGQLTWSTYMGGSGLDWGLGIAAADDGILVSGKTASDGWVSGGYDTERSGTDAFVLKLTEDGTHVWSTYLGGESDDDARKVTVDTAGDVIVGGFTYSATGIATGPDTTRDGTHDGFVMKLTSAGQLCWSTYVGGSSGDVVYDIAVDDQDQIHVVGVTGAADFLVNPLDARQHGQNDVFLMTLGSDGTPLWSTSIGGTGSDVGRGIAVGDQGRIVAVAQGNSTRWNLTSGTSRGADDAFIVAFAPTDVVPPTNGGGAVIRHTSDEILGRGAGQFVEVNGDLYFAYGRGYTLLVDGKVLSTTEIWRINTATQSLELVDTIQTLSDRSLQAWRAVGSKLLLSPINSWGSAWAYDVDSATLTQLDGQMTVNGLAGVVHNGQLFFTGRKNNSIELWVTDGTPDGTTQLTNSGISDGVGSNAISLGEYLYFSRWQEGVWRTDGTPSGTGVVIPDLQITSMSKRLTEEFGDGKTMYLESDLIEPRVVDGIEGRPWTSGKQVWSSDGTVGGTKLDTVYRTQFPITFFDTRYVLPNPNTLVGNQMFAVGNPPDSPYSNGAEDLWKYDVVLGANGLQISSPEHIKGFDSSCSFDDAWCAIYPQKMTPFGDRLLFWQNGAGYYDDDDWRLSVSDGTPEGTYEIFTPSDETLEQYSLVSITVLQDRAYVLTEGLDPKTGLHSPRLRVTDGETVQDVFDFGVLETAWLGASGNDELYYRSVSLGTNETKTYTVRNRPTARTGGDLTLDEGQTTLIDGSTSSPLPGAGVQYEWDLDYDGSTFDVDATGVTASFNAVDGPAVKTVALRVTDQLGLTGIETAQVTVNNVAPIIQEIGDRSAPLGTAISLNPLVFDPAVNDALSYSWDMGDGNSYDDPTVSHVYATEGEYFASLAVSDGESPPVIQNFRVVIGPPVTVTIDKSSLAEPDSATITATIATALTEDVVIPLTYSGTASLNADLGADQGLLPTEIRILANTSSANVTLQNLADTLDEDDETVEIELGIPSNASLATPGPLSITLVDDDPKPKFWLTSTSTTVNEDVGLLNISAQLSRVSGRDVVIPLSFTGAALPGVDFQVPTPAEIVIPAGQLNSDVALTIVDDNLGEPGELINIKAGPSLQADASNNPSKPDTQSILVAANDAPTVSFDVALVDQAESAGTVDVTVSLSNPSTQPVSVEFSLSGNAIDPDDYSLINASSTLTFDPNQTQQVITFNLVDDSLEEADESIVVDLLNPVNVTLGATPTGIVRIADNESRKVSLTASQTRVWEDVGQFTIRAELDAPSPVPVTVPISVAGTAEYLTDYDALLSDIVIPADSLYAEVIVTVNNDSQNERLGETIEFRAGTPTDAVLDVDTVTVYLDDDDPLASLVPDTKIDEYCLRNFFWMPSLPSSCYQQTYLSDLSEGESESITIKLDHPSNKPVPVFIQRTGGLTNSDVTHPSVVYVPKDVTEWSFDVDALTDNLDERTEVGRLTIRTHAGASSTAWNLTINDTTVLGPKFTSTLLFASEDAPSTQITVELTNGSTEDQLLPIFASGTAKKDSDFYVTGLEGRSSTYLLGSLRIPAGQKSRSFTLHFVNNETPEPTEKLVLKGPGSPADSEFLNQLLVTIADDGDTHPVEELGSPSQPGHDDWSGRLEAARNKLNPCRSGYIVCVSPISTEVSTKGLFGWDGYIQGGEAFFDGNFNRIQDFVDTNGNGLQDAGEPVEVAATTLYDGASLVPIAGEFDINGNGLLDVDEGQWVLAGGRDVSTDLDLPISLTAPANYPVISPLSTLVNALRAQTGDSLDVVETRVAEGLGISREVLPANVILAAADGSSADARGFAASVKLYATIAQAAKFLGGFGGAPSVEFLGHQVLNNLAGKLAGNGSVADFADANYVRSVIQGTALTLGISVPQDSLVVAANLIAAANERIDTIPFAADRSYLEMVVRVQKVAEGAAADQLAQLGNGTVVPDDIAVFTSQLDARIQSATIGNVVVPYLYVTDAVVTEGDSGQRVLSFEVGLETPSNVPVSVDFSTQDFTAEEADGDYVPHSGTLTWAAGDATTRTVTINVNGDTRLEPDEAVLVVLSNPQNTEILQAFGYGWIVNDDAFDYIPPADGSDNNLSLEFTAGQVILLRNDELIFAGPFTDVTAFNIAGVAGVANTLEVITEADATDVTPPIYFTGQGANDALVIDDSTASNVVQQIDGMDRGHFDVDGAKVHYLNVPSVNDVFVPQVSGIPTDPKFGELVSLASVLPVSDLGNSVVRSWLVVQGTTTVASSDAADLDFTLSTPGTYDLSLTITAEGRATSELRRSFEVPIPLEVDHALVEIFEGQVARNSGSLEDLSASLAATIGAVSSDATDPTKWHWLFDDGLDDLAATVAVTATNANQAQATVSFDLKVVNLPPDVSIASTVGELVLAVGQTASFHGSYIDPGVLDTHTAVWTFSHRDVTGTAVSEDRSGIAAGGSVMSDFSFSEAGVYTVTLTVTDDDGGSTTSTESIFVVYDPAEGFVTGGGWIDSPAGAYVSDPQLTGKASFGFVSKYKKGANRPTGSTEFKFAVADFRFHSSNYDWLVVAGSRAQFKGVGTINGSGNYGFLLTAIDGKLSGGERLDRFRIKIWNIDNGEMVYDNQLSVPDDGDPTTTLGGGQIVIHKQDK